MEKRGQTWHAALKEAALFWVTRELMEDRTKTISHVSPQLCSSSLPFLCPPPSLFWAFPLLLHSPFSSLYISLLLWIPLCHPSLLCFMSLLEYELTISGPTGITWGLKHPFLPLPTGIERPDFAQTSELSKWPCVPTGTGLMLPYGDTIHYYSLVSPGPGKETDSFEEFISSGPCGPWGTVWAENHKAWQEGKRQRLCSWIDQTIEEDTTDLIAAMQKTDQLTLNAWTLICPLCCAWTQNNAKLRTQWHQAKSSTAHQVLMDT